MQLSKLLEGLEITKSVNDLNLDITNVHSDSRQIEANGLFVAINGYLKKGIEFLDDAIKNGAIAALVEDEVDISTLPQNITYIKVKESLRRALAVANCNCNWHTSSFPSCWITPLYLLKKFYHIFYS